MFRALLAYPQEAFHKRHLVYCVRVMSVGCATTAVSLQSWHLVGFIIPAYTKLSYFHFLNFHILHTIVRSEIRSVLIKGVGSQLKEEGTDLNNYTLYRCCTSTAV
jgi:hypothetical protein